MTFKNLRGAEDMIPESFAKGTIMSLWKRDISHYANAIDGLHFRILYLLFQQKSS